MAVVLKNAVVDQLRAARSADDVLSRLRANSWETKRTSLLRMIESSEWKFGPAELVATFAHHVLAKAPNGDVVQVEWSEGENGQVYLGRAVVHESSTPVADIGYEVMQTARAAVDKILDEDYEGALPMIAGIAEALDVRGDLQRQISNEVLIQSLTRRAWWHDVIGIQEDTAEKLPDLNTEDVQRSATDLLAFLKEQATALSLSTRQLGSKTLRPEIETLATDVAEDVQRAITALLNLDRRQSGEVTKIYEAVMTAAPQLLSGIAYLKKLSENSGEGSVGTTPGRKAGGEIT
jgi:hypothetical protein